jgi:flagellin-specific chaperone FliS
LRNPILAKRDYNFQRCISFLDEDNLTRTGNVQNKTSNMIRSLQSALLLSVLAIAPLENTLNPAYSAQAQTPVVAATCDTNVPIQNRLAMVSEQARSALEQSDSEEALQSLQQASTIATQLQNSRIQADFLQQWLLDNREAISLPDGND